MSFDSKPITSILILLVAFLLARYITDSFNFFATEGWTGLYNLFVFPVYIIVLISIMSFFFFLFWNIMSHIFYEDDSEENNNLINKKYKKNLYTKIGKVEKSKGLLENKSLKVPLKKKSFSYINKTNIRQTKTKPSIVDISKNTLKYTGYTIAGVLSIFLLIILFIKYNIDSNSSKNYKKTFYEHHQTNDYNDSKIIFYNNELEKYTLSFMRATTKYDIFKSYSEQEIAHQCIAILLENYSVNNTSNLVHKFKLNARNKYKNSEKLINRASKNQKFISRYFTNSSTYITYPIRNILHGMPRLCADMVSVEHIYSIFIPQHIKSISEQIESRKHNMSTTNNSNHGQRKVNNLISWLNNLYKHNPKYKKKMYKKYKYQEYLKYNKRGYDDSL